MKGTSQQALSTTKADITFLETLIRPYFLSASCYDQPRQWVQFQLPIPDYTRAINYIDQPAFGILWLIFQKIVQGDTGYEF